MNKVYIILIDASLPYDASAFHRFLTSLYPIRIHGWWHYLPGNAYFIASRLNATQLYKLIYPGIPQRKFIVMEANPNNQEGWLTRKAWNWFNAYKK